MLSAPRPALLTCRLAPTPRTHHGAARVPVLRPTLIPGPAYKLSPDSYCTKDKAHSLGYRCTRVCQARALPTLPVYLRPPILLSTHDCSCSCSGLHRALASTLAPGPPWELLAGAALFQDRPAQSGLDFSPPPSTSVSCTLDPWWPRCPLPSAAMLFPCYSILRGAPLHSLGFRINMQLEAFLDYHPRPPRPGQAQHCSLLSLLPLVLALGSLLVFRSGSLRVQGLCLSVPLPPCTPARGTAPDPAERWSLSSLRFSQPPSQAKPVS